MRSLGLRALLMLFMAFLLSCGDPRVDATYRGTPLLKYRGQVAYSETFPDAEYDIRLSVFWSPTGIDSTIEGWHEQSSASVSIDFPSTFEIELYQPPVQKHFMNEYPFIALGRLLLYDDRDHDGRFSNEDVFVGGADTKAVVYSDHKAGQEENPFGLDMQPGFYLINIPLSCNSVRGPQPFPGASPEGHTPECQKFLGNVCTEETSDVWCGEGVCLPDDGSIFGMPGGYCALEVEGHFCDPGLGKIMAWELDGVKKKYYFRACMPGRECRVDEGYICHELQRVCLPDTPVFLLLEPDYQPTSYCLETKEL